MTSRLPASQARKLGLVPKRSKYGNRKVVVDGRKYDSQAEAAYGERLLLRERVGEVGGVEMHPRFKLLGPKGELICVYVADFAFWDHAEDRFRVVDVKGVETDVFKLKRKMMQALKGIEVEVVKV